MSLKVGVVARLHGAHGVHSLGLELAGAAAGEAAVAEERVEGGAVRREELL